MRWDILDAFADAADRPASRKRDFNTGDNSGVGYFQVNQKAGRRWSTARGFLKPALIAPNLKLETGAMVDHVVMQNKRAVGVAWFREERGEVEHHVSRAARCVILAAGAVQSPKLLELSGIGQGARLQTLGVHVVHDSRRRREPAGPSPAPPHLQGLAAFPR